METFLTIFISTFSIMVIAEFGDKTNLIALSLMSSSKHPYRIALFSTVGIAMSTILSVVIGAFLGSNLPIVPIRYVTALIFVFLGISTFYENNEHNENEELDQEYNKDVTDENKFEEVPFYKPIYLVGIAEFGDKSQLFAISASAATSPLAVFFGSITGMGVIMFLTAFFGSIFFEKVDPEKLEKVAALLFIFAGLWIGISTILG